MTFGAFGICELDSRWRLDVEHADPAAPFLDFGGGAQALVEKLDKCLNDLTP